MKKTYVTTLPDHVGAFLQASRRLTELGINITRLSYNKAVDVHTLFIEVSGTGEQLEKADQYLAEIGYLQKEDGDQSIVLLEFRLRDRPGVLPELLELIQEFGFNISYMSFQERKSDYQLFKAGLYVENRERMDEFLSCADRRFDVRVIDYNHTEKNFDNSIFYQSYAAALAACMDVDEEGKEEMLINVNLAMQLLDERGMSPYRTFDTVSRFAEFLARYRGEAFEPRITEHALTEQTKLILIEPPCGSNTTILKHGSEYLFIDTGYACYKEEMLKIFRRLIPEYDSIRKRALITHPDFDHCGLLPLFDEVLMSEKSRQCLEAEHRGEEGFREKLIMHKPYLRICKTLTGYKPVSPEKVTVFCGDGERPKVPMQPVGFFSFGDLNFEVYEGQGGHVPGEIVLIDYEHKLVFTGDIYINIKGQTPEQATYNQYAPILMMSVDTDPALCRIERNAILQRLGVGEWQIFGGHGMKKEYGVHL